MEIRIKKDSVEIEGYVNAIERNSKTLRSRVGDFIERICKGAFKKALRRNDDVHILLNHNWDRDLGSTKQGNLELEEDNIGLKAKATITDEDVIKKARNGDLVGWSFGFVDRDVENTLQNGIPLRAVKDLDLFEVSILDRTKTPAYEGTLIMARAEDETVQFMGEDFIDEVQIREEETQEEKQEQQEEPKQEEVLATDEGPKQQEVVENNINYSQYENMIKEMKGA